MVEPLNVLVVGASGEQQSHLERCASEWSWRTAADAAELTDHAEAVDLFIVFAAQSESDTLATCEQLRANPESTPLILVVGRYQIGQATAVRRLGNASFVISPFNARELKLKVEQLRTSPSVKE